MNKQYLQKFTEEQLLHYIQTLKQRVNDMRQFTVELERENAELEKEYSAIVTEKKLLNKQLIGKSKGWNRWVSAGKEAVSNMIDIVKRPKKDAYEPKQNQDQIKKSQQQEINQIINQNVSEESKKEVASKQKVITIGNFDFDDLYHLGKDKFAGLLDKSNNKMRDIAVYIKQRYTQRKSENQPQHINQRTYNIQLEKQSKQQTTKSVD